MSKTKLRRILDDMMGKAVRDVAPIVSAIPERCKFCGSQRIVRFGHYQGVQRWWCKEDITERYPEYTKLHIHNAALNRTATLLAKEIWLLIGGS